MKRIVFLSLFVFCLLGQARGQRPTDIGCLADFQVESMTALSSDYPDPTRRGKLEIGVVRLAKRYVQDVIGYALVDPADPVYSLLKDAYFNNLSMQLCFNQKTAKEFEKQAGCQTCTARGEIQGEITILSATYLAEKAHIPAKDPKSRHSK